MIRDNQVQQMQMLSMTENQGNQAALGGPEMSRENRVCFLSCHTEQLLEDCKKLQEKVKWQCSIPARWKMASLNSNLSYLLNSNLMYLLTSNLLYLLNSSLMYLLLSVGTIFHGVHSVNMDEHCNCPCADNMPLKSEFGTLVLLL